LGYGLKTMPLPEAMNLVPAQRALFEFYGFSPLRW
jgi:hypothetical protein